MASPERPLEDVRNTLGEYARILRSRWRLAVTALAVAGALAFWYSQFLPRRYGASTVFERRDDAVLRNLVSKNSPYSFDNLKTTLSTDLTGSRALAEAAVETGLLAPDVVPASGALSDAQLRELDAALAAHQLTAGVKLLQSTPSLDTIRVDCEANDPQIAQRFVVALRDRYIRQTRQRITEILEGTREFFQGEVDRYQHQLAQTAQNLASPFDEFPGVDPTDLTGVGLRLESLRQERERLFERQAELEAQVAAREQFLLQLVQLDGAGAPTPATWPATTPAPATPAEQALVQAIASVERELEEATTTRRMTPEHPTVMALQRKLDNLRQSLLAAHPPAAPGAAAAPAAAPTLRAERLQAELERDALQLQLAVVQGNFERAAERLARFTALYDQLLSRGQEFQQLNDRREEDTTTLAMWREHLGQLTRILAAENEQRGTQFALVEEPKGAGALSPRVGPVFAVCSGSGLAAAALLVALAELLDRSFRSTGQVARALGIPVLESVGVIQTRAVRRQRWLQRLAWTPALMLLLGILIAAAGLAYTSLENPALHRKLVGRVDTLLSREAGAAPPAALHAEN